MHYTYHYKQPEGYHFSFDSLQLAQFVASELRTQADLSSLRVLDLCAGCGVVGIELSWHLRSIRQIDFLEVQDVYTECFYHNMVAVNRPELKVRWHLLNYDALHQPEWTEKFDLIISNPPYFLANHGMLSPSEFKNRCRFFIDSSFEHYIQAIENALANNGRAYFLLRPLKHHGLDLFHKTQQLLKHTPTIVKKITTIRGTDVVLISK